MSVRQRCQAVADDQKLGQVQNVHRGRRFDPVLVAGEAKRWWAYGILGVLLLGLPLGWVALLLLVVCWLPESSGLSPSWLRFEDPLQSHKVRYPERYEIVGKTTGGDEITVRVSQFTRQRRLIGAVERRQTSPVVLTRTRRQLAAAGEVAFGPVVLRQGGDLLVHDADRNHKIPAGHIDWAGSLRNT